MDHDFSYAGWPAGVIRDPSAFCTRYVEEMNLLGRRGTRKAIMGMLIGALLGGALGYFGMCAQGACPLTASPVRGAVFGAILGLLIAVS